MTISKDRKRVPLVILVFKSSGNQTILSHSQHAFVNIPH